MRVTESMMYGTLSRGILKAQQRTIDAQNAASSGQRVAKISDDPGAAARGMLYDTGLRKLGAMEQAAGRAELEMLAASDALNNTQTLLGRARELALIGANAGLGAIDRAALAAEVGSVREGVLALANTKVGDVYLFSGFASDAAAFASDGSYQGDGGERAVEVAPGVNVAMNIAGDSAFGDLFGVLDALQAALQTNDPEAVRTQLGALGQATDALSLARIEVDSGTGRLNDSSQLRADLQQRLAAGRSAQVEQDQVTSYMNLLQSQQALQAAMTQAGKLLAVFRDGFRSF